MRIRFTLAFIILLGVAGELWAQSSPFMRAGKANNTVPTVTKDQKFALTGVIKMDQTPLVCVTEVAVNRSHWIKVGESSSGISVTHFDAENNTAVIRHGGENMELVLQEPTFAPSKLAAYQPSSSSSPLPSAGVAIPQPVTNKEKETEARMLVSDLLEIGMIQRKAYEKAKAEEVAAKRETRKAE